jgi:ribosomal protein S30
LSPMWNSLDLCCFLSSFIQRSRYCLQIYMSTLLNSFSRVFSIPTKTELHPSPPKFIIFLPCWACVKSFLEKIEEKNKQKYTPRARLTHLFKVKCQKIGSQPWCRQALSFSRQTTINISRGLRKIPMDQNAKYSCRSSWTRVRWRRLNHFKTFKNLFQN